MKSLYNLYRKLFLDGEWRVAYRCKNGSLFEGRYIPIDSTNQYWFADPLLYEEDGKAYLFCEAFDKKELKGKLGYFSLDGNNVSEFKLLIDENYHMSFPNVFKYNGKYYIIPESGENLTLDLYEALDFPGKWEKRQTLIKGYNYVDPTIIEVAGVSYLFVYQDKRGDCKTLIYKIKEDLTLDFVQSISYEQNAGRSAGKPFITDSGKLLRPVQYGEGEYGKYTIFYEITFGNGGFTETKVGQIDNAKIIVGRKKGVDRIHTYCQSDNYETIDYTIYKFHLFKRFKILVRKWKKNKRHN